MSADAAGREPVEVLTLGESMGLVMGPPAAPLRIGSDARISFAGAESNVAIGLARLGHRVAYAGRLGDDPIGAMIRDSIRGEGVDVEHLRTDPSAPTALMVRQHRTADRLTVMYYRDRAAGSQVRPADVPDEALRGVRIVHLTGITAALGGSARETVTDLVRRAKAAGATVSFDVNHRAKLWSAADARAVLTPLLADIDILFGGDEELLLLDGAEVADETLENGAGARAGSLDAPEEAAPVVEASPDVSISGSDSVVDAARRLLTAGPGTVVRKRGARGATTYDADGAHDAAAISVTAVDPVGAGDAFVAGFLSGLLDGLDVDGCLARAVEAGAFSVSVHGDWEGLPRRSELGMLGGSEDVAR